MNSDGMMHDVIDIVLTGRHIGNPSLYQSLIDIKVHAGMINVNNSHLPAMRFFYYHNAVNRCVDVLNVSEYM